MAGNQEANKMRINCDSKCRRQLFRRRRRLQPDLLNICLYYFSFECFPQTTVCTCTVRFLNKSKLQLTVSILFNCENQV